MYIEKINSPDDLKKLSIPELKAYADEARQFIMDSVKKNGGHLASNLGAVELSIALHYVFDSPNDKLIWDVGHQAYTHKLITGRMEELKNLRTNLGASGFPSIKESQHDLFTSGHSSNSLSLALGLCRANDYNKEESNVIPIIGDGAFSGGMVYEALNDIGESQKKVIIILNDNKMSIAKNVGAMSKYFAKLRLSKKYNSLKKDIRKSLSVLPFGNDFKALESVKMRMRSVFMASRLFENFGITYYGPFDGHNIEEMLDVFKKASLRDKPVIIHIITQKGKGDIYAEIQPEKYHGVSASVCANEIKEKSFSDAFCNALIDLADDDKRITAITAAMPSGTGLNHFIEKYPNRCIDVSIAEEHAITMAAGLAKGGMKPVFAVYSTFLQRGFDQILHDVCINNLPVVFAIDRAGAIGADGVTHQGIFDLSYLSMIPNLVVMTPKDSFELKAMLKLAIKINSPCAIRYPKSYIKDYDDCGEIMPYKWQVLNKSDSNVYVLAAGSRMLDIAFMIKDINIINARFINPLDADFLDSINKKDNKIITLEDNIKRGGFGESVLCYCHQKSLKASIDILAHKNEFCDNRSVEDMMKQSNITAEEILNIINR